MATLEEARAQVQAKVRGLLKVNLTAQVAKKNSLFVTHVDATIGEINRLCEGFYASPAAVMPDSLPVQDWKASAEAKVPLLVHWSWVKTLSRDVQSNDSPPRVWMVDYSPGQPGTLLEFGRWKFPDAKPAAERKQTHYIRFEVGNDWSKEYHRQIWKDFWQTDLPKWVHVDHKEGAADNQLSSLRLLRQSPNQADPWLHLYMVEICSSRCTSVHISVSV